MAVRMSPSHQGGLCGKNSADSGNSTVKLLRTVTFPNLPPLTDTWTSLLPCDKILQNKDLFQRLGSDDRWEGDFQVESK